MAPHLLVDAMNVIGTRPDGWWRDRNSALRALVVKLQAYAADDSVDITLFIDGAPVAALPEGSHDGVTVLYARRGGRDAADDRLVEFIEGHPEPAALHVITSDRGLASRVRSRGAQVHGTRSLLEQLDALTPDEP